MPKSLLIAGNYTMPSNVGIFNIPPLLTCYPSEWCKEHCYALHNRFLWPSVRKAMMWRYKQSLKDNFVSKMVEELKRRKILNGLGYILQVIFIVKNMFANGLKLLGIFLILFSERIQNKVNFFL